MGRARSKERPSSLCAPPLLPPRGPINRPGQGCGQLSEGVEHQAAVSSQAPCQHGQRVQEEALLEGGGG